MSTSVKINIVLHESTSYYICLRTDQDGFCTDGSTILPSGYTLPVKHIDRNMYYKMTPKGLSFDDINALCLGEGAELSGLENELQKNLTTNFIRQTGIGDIDSFLLLVHILN